MSRGVKTVGSMDVFSIAPKYKQGQKILEEDACLSSQWKMASGKRERRASILDLVMCMVS